MQLLRPAIEARELAAYMSSARPSSARAWAPGVASCGASPRRRGRRSGPPSLKAGNPTGDVGKASWPAQAAAVGSPRAAGGAPALEDDGGAAADVLVRSVLEERLHTVGRQEAG